jgi:fucose permease
VIALAPLTARLLAHDREPQREQPDESAAKARRWTGMVALLGMIAFASMLCEGAAADWSAVYLRDSLGASKLVASLGYAVFVLAMVVVRLRADRLFARYAVARVLSVLAGLAAVIFAIGLLSSNEYVALVGLLALGAGLAAVVPSVFSAAGNLPGIPSGAGIAAVSALGWAGFVFGPPVIGQLAALTSLPVALGLVPVLTAFIAVAVRYSAFSALPSAGQGEQLLVGHS